MRHILIMILSLLVTSCIVWGSYETNIDNIMDGSWEIIGTNDILNFSSNGHFNINDTITATYYKVKEHDKVHWSWESSDDVDRLFWKTDDNQEGILYYEGYENDHNTLFITGLPLHENETVKIVKLLN